MKKKYIGVALFAACSVITFAQSPRTLGEKVMTVENEGQIEKQSLLGS